MPGAAEIVERVLALGPARLTEALELLHVDAEWVREPDLPPLRGRDAIREHVEREIERLGDPLPEALPLSLLESENRVVVFGQVRTPRAHDDGTYVEVVPMAWLYEVHDGCISRVSGFKTWAAARAAAEIPDGSGTTRRLPTRWALAVPRLPRLPRLAFE